MNNTDFPFTDCLEKKMWGQLNNNLNKQQSITTSK